MLFSTQSDVAIAQFGFGQHISIEDLDNPYRTIFLTDTWRYAPGDNSDWAEPHFDDLSWDEVSTQLGAGDLPFIEWIGHGWFRLTLEVDESLVAVPLALDIVMQSGASELYHNGVLLYTFGVVSDNPINEIAYQERRPRTIIFKHPGTHVLAVRYSNHKAQQFIDAGFNAGFRFLLVDMNHQITGVVDSVRVFSMQQFYFTGILTVFTIIHFLLFVFYPRQYQNVYFALFTGFFGLLYYLDYQILFSTSGFEIIRILSLRGSLVMVTMVFFMLFCYAIFYSRLPRQFWYFLIGFIVVGTISFARNNSHTEWLILVLSGIFVFEILRILLVALYQRKNGAWIISSGMLLFVASQLYIFLIHTQQVEFKSELTGNTAEFLGIVSLLITMSVSLSRNFAETNNRLELKLHEVQLLSQKAIEQEREQKSRELERLLLEADNLRKTNELEDARNLQLSMLPAIIPDTSFARVAVRMKTATEVGGDYYDFVVAPTGELTAVIGDATGHGVKAGIVVATAKSYFNTFANDPSLTNLLKVLSTGIRNMNLRMLYMTVMVVRVSKGHLQLAGAGMPPALLYRHQSGEVEILTSKGMPMGSVRDYPYTELKTKLCPDDVLLMLSDGYIEAFNSERCQFGLDQVVHEFRKSAGKSPEDILTDLESAINQWTRPADIEDDYTLMIIKIKQ